MRRCTSSCARTRLCPKRRRRRASSRAFRTRPISPRAFVMRHSIVGLTFCFLHSLSWTVAAAAGAEGVTRCELPHSSVLIVLSSWTDSQERLGADRHPQAAERSARGAREARCVVCFISLCSTRNVCHGSGFTAGQFVINLGATQLRDERKELKALGFDRQRAFTIKLQAPLKEGEHTARVFGAVDSNELAA